MLARQEKSQKAGCARPFGGETAGPTSVPAVRDISVSPEEWAGGNACPTQVAWPAVKLLQRFLENDDVLAGEGLDDFVEPVAFRRDLHLHLLYRHFVLRTDGDLWILGTILH